MQHRLAEGGKVADPTAEIWVPIHPMEVSSMWVQPKPTVRSDGSWTAVVYMGQGGKYIGKSFEIRAFANS